MILVRLTDEMRLNNQDMKHTRSFLVFLLGISIVLPVGAMAQTATSSDTAASSTTSRRQRFNEWGDSHQWGYGGQRSNELQQKIAALPTAAVTTIPMPVLFGVGLNNISPNFGDPRSGGRTHEGEDIMAVKGTPVVSPTDAVVLRIAVQTLAGNYVTTANPGGEIFEYIHLDRFAEGLTEGMVLAKGALIGYVGNTGNASGGAAHLHFEVRDKSGDPIDPFPRLTSELTLQEKITYLSQTLTQTSDPKALAELLVMNFRSTFASALIANITLPQQIIDALATVSVGASPATSARAALPVGDLDIGSSGTPVVELQSYLIQAASGSATASLAKAGPTGYFGPITQAALAEYQRAVSISPATGYYGPTTRSFIASHPLGASASIAATVPASSAVATALTQNLYFGLTAEDVRTLQKVLNANGYAVASSGAGSPGNETTYFGKATLAAVIKFQLAHNIAPAVGYAGPLTRNALALL